MNAAAKLAVFAGAIIFASLAAAVLVLPAFGAPIMDASTIIMSIDVPRTSAANLVCAITYDFRGYDTLGEAMLLSAAVGGVVIVLKPKKPESPPARGAAHVVKR